LFNTLQDRLAATFKNLRGKGRLSEADIDATCREIRVALLEADVALPAVREFIERVRERARGSEVSEALNRLSRSSRSSTTSWSRSSAARRGG
jgi:signal recognition particle subunit SRP54